MHKCLSSFCHARHDALGLPASQDRRYPALKGPFGSLVLADCAFVLLATMAAQNRRSMQEQAGLLLEREVRLHQPADMERARQWRERMRQRPMPHLLEDLRSDDDR